MRRLHFATRGGCHLSILRHEIYKYYRIERVGAILLVMCVWVMVFTKPIYESFSNMVDMNYKSYYLRLESVSTAEYGRVLQDFENEIDEARKNHVDESALSTKEEALQLIREYVEYLGKTEGTKVVYQKEYELLYNVRSRNIGMGIAALLFTILCGAAIGYSEFRSGMHQMIRISYKGKYKVLFGKLVILGVTLAAVFAMIYGRYVYQVLRGYGTGGITYQANSMMNWRGVSAEWSIGGYLIWIYAQRFVGMLIAAVITWFVMRKLKSYILTVITCVGVMVLPLLLCLFKVNGIDWVMMNYFFV